MIFDETPPLYTSRVMDVFSVQGCVGQSILDFMGGSILNNISKKISPRFVKSHLPKDLLPTQIWEKKAKVIFVVRNPKDVAVSNYHHYKLFHTYEGTLNEFLEAFLDDKGNVAINTC